MLKLYYGAIRDLDNDVTDACSILAEDLPSAEKMVRTYYDTCYHYYEFEVTEQSQEELNDYLQNYPEDKLAGLYHNAPTNHAYLVFC